jgi:epsilon-lactone hydrolase
MSSDSSRALGRRVAFETVSNDQLVPLRAQQGGVWKGGRMASKESAAVKTLWSSWTEEARANPNATLEEVRARVSHWGDITTEPGGVDYLEIGLNGLPALWAVPKGSAEDRVILCLHGGGFLTGSIFTHRKLFAHLAKAVGARALLAEYRLTPENPHPSPLEDTTAAYRWLLDQGIEPGHVAIAGDSSGGGLTLTTTLRARALGWPTPAALLLMSPWVDMATSSDTFESNREAEAFFYREVVDGLAQAFLGGTDPKDPWVSPLYADLGGLPPTSIQVGGDETLLGEALRLDKTMREAGVDVQLEVFPDQQHTFQMAAGYAPESDDAIRKLAAWARPRLGLA